MTTLPTRRATLGLLASAAGAALTVARAAPAAAQLPPSPFGGLPIPGGAPGGAPGAAAPAGGLRISRVAVDTAALRSPFDGSDAALLARDLAGDLRHVFADLMVGSGDRGVTLLARVHSLYLPPWAGDRRGNAGDGPDNIEGVGIVASGGRVLSETPLYTTLNPSYSGAWYLPDINERRIASISYQFAYWLRREMGV